LFKLGARSFSKGDHYKKAKMGWGHLEIVFRTTEPKEPIFT
jgi:hypothetical protein